MPLIPWQRDGMCFQVCKVRHSEFRLHKWWSQSRLSFCFRETISGQPNFKIWFVCIVHWPGSCGCCHLWLGETDVLFLVGGHPGKLSRSTLCTHFLDQSLLVLSYCDSYQAKPGMQRCCKLGRLSPSTADVVHLNIAPRVERCSK